MRPLPITIMAFFLIGIGIASICALIVPATQPYMQPAWIVGLAAMNLVVTGVGFWAMRRWAIVFFILMWVLQALLVVLTGATINGAPWIGLVLVLGAWLAYRRRFV